MADTIKPPALPETRFPHGRHNLSAQEVRAIQREAMRAALEAAAKFCDTRWAADEYLWPEDIRALRIEGETP